MVSTYVVKPSIKLIYSTIRDNLYTGDTPILAYILFVEYSYTNQEILRETGWAKGNLSRYLTKGYEQIKDPVKKLHCEIYLNLINGRFQSHIRNIDTRMLNFKEKIK